MDSRGLPGGQSGRPGWTVGQSGMDSRPVSRADSDHFGKLESFHSRHHLTQTWSDLRCRSINMLFSHPPAAPGASQGAPVAWIRENRTHALCVCVRTHDGRFLLPLTVVKGRREGSNGLGPPAGVCEASARQGPTPNAPPVPTVSLPRALLRRWMRSQCSRLPLLWRRSAGSKSAPDVLWFSAS